jgi:hypothetical protein
MIQNTPPYSPSFPLSLYPPTSHWKRPIFSSFFFKVYIYSPREFCFGTSGLYISCFNQINPPLVTDSLSPCSPNIQQLTLQCIILYSYRDGLYQ